MAAELETLLVRIDADIERLRRGLKGADTATAQGARNIQRQTTAMERAFDRLGRQVLVTVGAFAGLRGVQLFAGQVRESIRAADAIGKVADKVGVTTSELQELRFAAEQSGVAQTALDMGLQRFSRRLGEAANGMGELRGIIRQYGIQIRDSNGRMRSSIDIMSDFADVISRTESSQEQLRIAFKLFDSEGAALVNLLRDGSESMDRLRERARELGIVLNEDMIRGAEDANDRLNELSKTISTNLTEAFLNAAPAIIKLTEAMAYLTQNGPRQWGEDTRKALGLPIPNAISLRDALAQIVAYQNALREFPNKTLIEDPGIFVRAPKVESAEIPTPTFSLPDGVSPFDFMDEIGGKRSVLQSEDAAALEEAQSKAMDALTSLEDATLRATGRTNQAILRETSRSLNEWERLWREGAISTGDFLEASAMEFEKVSADLKKSVDEVSESVEESGIAYEIWTRNVADGFADAIVNARSLGDVLTGLLKQLAKAELSNLFSSALGLEGGGSILGKIFGGGKAAGGPVAGGTPYLVGERGPELFVPNVAGKIVPNHQMGGGQPIIVNQTVRFDVGLESVDTRIANAAPTIMQAARDGTISALNRMGPRKVFG